jgi:hypothetical protein
MLVAIHRIEWMVKVAEANIRAILAGKSPRKTYKAKTGHPTMAVSRGSLSGVDFGPPIGPLIPMYRKKLGPAA